MQGTLFAIGMVSEFDDCYAAVWVEVEGAVPGCCAQVKDWQGLPGHLGLVDYVELRCLCWAHVEVLVAKAKT